MDTAKTILKTIGNVIFYAVIACIIIAGIASFFGIKPYITMSGSMEPVIHTGSICFVNTNADYDDIKLYDVIAYQAETGGLVTHRVINITPDGMETKGDNNETSDGISTTQENFRGKNLFSVPLIGYIIRYIQQPAGMTIVGVILATSVVLTVLNHNSKKEDEE